MTNEEVIKKIVEEFDKPRKEFNGLSYRTRERDWLDKLLKIKPYLSKENLQKLNIEDAIYIYENTKWGYEPDFNINLFKENDIQRIRESLIYLFYGNDPIEDRFFNITYNSESKYKLSGVRRHKASLLLFIFNRNEYSVWNSSMETGLSLLKLLPKREKFEHKGHYYLKINKVIKELTKLCGFDDLSYTVEFLDLITCKKIGKEILRGNLNEEKKSVLIEEEKVEEEKEEEDLHTKMQWLIIKIGLLKGYDVWVAKNDQNKKYNNEKFSELCLNNLPHFTNPDVLEIAQFVDVIWFKKKTTNPIAFFEIETTTSIYSGLLRLNDIIINFPIDKAYIISSDKKRDLFETQIRRKTFVYTGLDEVCQFKTYKEIEDIYNKLKDFISIDL